MDRNLYKESNFIKSSSSFQASKVSNRNSPANVYEEDQRHVTFIEPDFNKTKQIKSGKNYQ